MATMQDLYSALRKADAAGNTADAQRIASMIRQSQAGTYNRPRDGAIGYSVDQAQRLLGKGVEVAGDLVGSDTVKGFGSNIVAQQDKDIAEGGYQPTYTGSLRDTYKEGGIGSALGWIAEKSAENLVSGGLALGGTAVAAITAPFSAPAALIIGGGTLAGSGVMIAGESAFEQEDKNGEYNSAIAAGTGVIGGILDKFGAGKVIKPSSLSSMTGEEIVEALLKEGSQGSLDAATEIGKRIAKAGIAEGATETAQEGAIVGSAAVQGGEYTARELADRGLESFVLGGTMGSGTRAGIDTTKATGRGIKNTASAMMPEGYTPTDATAASDLASRLQRISKADGMNLNNVSNKMDDKGAVRAVDQAHKEITTELNSLKGDINELIKDLDTDTDDVRADKITARRAFEMARNKTKNLVGSAEFEAVERILGNTAEGQRLMQLFRESNELTGLHNAGYVGGLSKYTDAFSPLPTNTGYSDRSLVQIPTRLGISGAAAGYTGGASIPAQIGIVAGGRAIDKLTGRRSQVAKFVRDNQGQGSETPDAPKFRSQKALAKYQREQEKLAERQRRQDAKANQEQRDLEEAKRKAELALDATRRNDPPKGDPNDPKPSPQYVMESQSGLTRNGVKRALDIIKRTRPKLEKAALDYENMLVTGQPFDDLTPLIRAVKSVVQQNSEYFNDYRTEQALPKNVDDRKAQGKKKNEQFLKNLQEQINDSNGIANADKAILQNGLIRLSDNLFPDPVAQAQAILDDVKASLSKPALADKYIKPYIDRISGQQGKRQGALTL